MWGAGGREFGGRHDRADLLASGQGALKEGLSARRVCLAAAARRQHGLQAGRRRHTACRRGRARRRRASYYGHSPAAPSAGFAAARCSPTGPFVRPARPAPRPGLHAKEPGRRLPAPANPGRKFMSALPAPGPAWPARRSGTRHDRGAPAVPEEAVARVSRPCRPPEPSAARPCGPRSAAQGLRKREAEMGVGSWLASAGEGALAAA
jgi:hypothetical protein